MIKIDTAKMAPMTMPAIAPAASFEPEPDASFEPEPDAEDPEGKSEDANVDMLVLDVEVMKYCKSDD